MGPCKGRYSLIIIHIWSTRQLVGSPKLTHSKGNRLIFRQPQCRKNLGRLWHAYIRTPGRFYKLQLTSVDSGHLTQSELSLGWFDLHKIKKC